MMQLLGLKGMLEKPIYQEQFQICTSLVYNYCDGNILNGDVLIYYLMVVVVLLLWLSFISIYFAVGEGSYSRDNAPF